MTRKTWARLRSLAATVLPHTALPLGRALRADRWLLGATLLLLAFTWAPLFVTPFLPFADLPLNTASAELLWDAARGVRPAADYLEVQWKPQPYWTGYALACLFGRIVGPLWGAKLLTGLLLALLPLSLMRLLLSLGRDPRLGLWSFLLVWQQNLYAGWLAFVLGMVLVNWVLAWLIEARDARDALRLVPFTALVALTHVQATMLLGLAGLGLAFTTGPVLRRLGLHAVAGLGAAFSMLLWIGRVDGVGASAAASWTSIPVVWHTPAYRLSKVFGYTLDNFARPDAERVAAMAFVCAVLGPLAVGTLPARKVGGGASALVLVASAGVLYALLWWEIGGPVAHWYTYPRYAAGALSWLILVPAPNLRGVAQLALVPGVALSVWLDLKVIDQFRGFGERTRPLLQIIERVPARASVLPLVLDDGDADPDLRVAPYHQLYAYITAVGHGHSPYLWESRANPVVYYGPRKPAPGWGGRFSLDQHGKHYDYLLVQGFQNHGDPVARAAAGRADAPRLVLEAARWRLYQVR